MSERTFAITSESRTRAVGGGDMQYFLKDPDAVLDFTFDWASWLEGTDTISAHTLTIDTGLTKDSDSAGDDSVTAWLSGGTAGEDYDVVCSIETGDGREEDRTITIMVRER